MKYIMRVRADLHRRLAGLLQAAMPSESVAFVLCRRIEAAEAVIYLADEVLQVWDDDYLARAEDIASVSPGAMSRVAQRAKSDNRVIAMVHIHPMTKKGVAFSKADHVGNSRSFRFFHRRATQEEHLALVWSRDASECAGLVYLSDGNQAKLDSFVVVDGSAWGQCVRQAGPLDPTFGRQALLLGEEGQRRLAEVTFAIAGAGGVGSLVSLALVHHGARSVVLVDDQLLDTTNPPRVPACSPSDVLRTPKVRLAHDYAKHHAPTARIVPLLASVESEDAFPWLIGADILIVCTDNTTSRAYLNQLSHQYLTPLLDLGVQFSVDSMGTVVNEVGRINLMRPGSPCLCCTGHIDPSRLAAESVPKHERQLAGSYLRGFDDPQPSMLAFNMEVAGRGMQALVGYVTGLFAHSESAYEQRTFLKAKGGSMSRLVGKRRRESCPICGTDGVVGAGRDRPFFVTRRAS